MRVTNKDLTFYAHIDILSPLEWLDLEISENDSDSKIRACEVALAVTDWNGLGKVDPLFLLANRDLHKLVFQVSRVIDENRIQIPTLTATQEKDYIKVSGHGFYANLRNLTILEFMDMIAVVRRDYGDDLRSIFKAKAVASVVLDWNGLGPVDGDFLHENKDLHPYVLAIDIAVASFFRDDEDSVLQSNPVLDDNHHNGRYVAEPSSMESGNNSGKGFSVNVARISSS
jgi:hypothetical protein